jgi:putative ABC transport system ATP-binding protein
MEDTHSIVRCEQITKTFGTKQTRVEALRGVDMTLLEREILMICGPSGSGKTTLLSIIASILHPDSGRCDVLGTPINALSEEEKTIFRGKNIGFVFQAFNLIPMLTAQENTAIPLLIQGINRKEALERAKILLEKLGLSDKIHRKPSELSGGEQQRVSIARGCIHQPKVILCDEPTSLLDHKTGSKVLEILIQLQEETKCSLIIVTHDQRILSYADRIIEIEDGRITGTRSNHK